MKATLYARQEGSRWTWHTSVWMDADFAFWRNRQGGEAGLWLAGPSLSFGQAEALRRLLQIKDSDGSGLHPQKALQSISSQSITSQSITSQSSLPFQLPSSRFTLQYVSLHVGKDGSALSRTQSPPITPSELDAFIARLAGRQLLPGEAKALAESMGFEWGSSSESLLYALQLGRLQGRLRLEPGIREVSGGGRRSGGLADGHEGLWLQRVESAMRALSGSEGQWWRRWSGAVRCGIRTLSGTEKYKASAWHSQQEEQGRAAAAAGYACVRCGSAEGRLRMADCPFCGQACPYCEECLTMGRVRFCTPVIMAASTHPSVVQLGGHEHAVSDAELELYLRPWNLSDAQAAASLEGLKFLHRPQLPSTSALGKQDPAAFLIWAVTGAGKTEMVFPFLAAAIARGGKALVATPRKDVVLELSPRVRQAFPAARVVTLYGGSEERWDDGDIVIATTHQLMRFHEGFELVVIDELDAFPFHNNPTLAFAARKACKPTGSYILLSATPPPAMKRDAEHGRLPHVKVPVRYHRHPLPLPKLKTTAPMSRMLTLGALSPSLRDAIQFSLQREAQLFLFVPSISLVMPLVQLLRNYFTCDIRGTSSKDPERTAKVQAFRSGEVRILVTTTILERGVTVPKSDVIVLDADSRLFDEASLVQMAGRAGRSKADPAGSVTFMAQDRTSSQVDAVRHIKRMNRIAKRKRYLV